jgi:hypothetical protein
MNQDKLPSEDEKKLMAQYGITHTHKSVYFYEGHRYDKVSDAINYARDSLARAATTESTSSH